MQYFSRRKPISNWSKVNKTKVAKLIQNNRMMNAGYKAIETTKLFQKTLNLKNDKELILGFNILSVTQTEYK